MWDPRVPKLKAKAQFPRLGKPRMVPIAHYSPFDSSFSTHANKGVAYGACLYTETFALYRQAPHGAHFAL